MDLPFGGFHTVHPLRAYPNWRVNKHHVISHFMTCCNLVIKIWTVPTLLFELLQHKSLFIPATSCESTTFVISTNSPVFFWIPFQSSSSCLRSSSCLDLKAQPEKPTSACTLSAYLSLFAAPAHTFPAYIYFATPPSILSSCSSSCSSTNNHFSFLSFPLSVFVLFPPKSRLSLPQTRQSYRPPWAHIKSLHFKLFICLSHLQMPSPPDTSVYVFLSFV